MQSASLNSLVSPVYATDIGFFPNAQYHYRARQEGSNQNILIYCIKGEGFVCVNDKKKIIKKDTLFVIPKGTPHNYGSDESNPWTIYWVHFLGSNAEQYFNSDFNITNVSIDKGSQIKLLFDQILGSFENGYTQETMIYVSQILAFLLGTAFFFNSAYKLGSRDENIRVEESIFHMTRNLNGSLSLRDLAGQANLSVTHYSYLFRKKTGFSPVDYFIRLKIQKACQYLDVTNLKVTEIARELGFQDPYYFSRAFHKIMQQSPTAYRDIKKG